MIVTIKDCPPCLLPDHDSDSQQRFPGCSQDYKTGTVAIKINDNNRLPAPQKRTQIRRDVLKLLSTRFGKSTLFEESMTSNLGQLAGRLTGRPAGSGWPAGQPACQLASWQVGQLAGWLAGGLAGVLAS